LGQLAAASPRDAAMILGQLFGQGIEQRMGQNNPQTANTNYWLQMAQQANPNLGVNGVGGGLQ